MELEKITKIVHVIKKIKDPEEVKDKLLEIITDAEYDRLMDITSTKEGEIPDLDNLTKIVRLVRDNPSMFDESNVRYLILFGFQDFSDLAWLKKSADYNSALYKRWLADSSMIPYLEDQYGIKYRDVLNQQIAKLDKQMITKTDKQMITKMDKQMITKMDKQ
jgi:hypothetical protein